MVTYAVVVLDDTLCNLQVNTVNPIHETGLKVSPNPGSGALALTLDSDIDEQAQVVIARSVGRKVKEITIATNRVVDLELDLAPGIYLLSAYTGSGRYVAKVIIN